MDAARNKPWLRRIARLFDVSPAEVLGVAVLLVSAAAATGVMWWLGLPRPARHEPLPAPAASSAAGVAFGAIHAPAQVTVHVAGAVARPGIVRLTTGTRVADAVAAAGGATAGANLDGLNLAREVADGEQVYVPPAASEPGIGADDTTAPAAGNAAAGAWGPDGRLRLNRATTADLEELPGIGPVLAERIVAFRDDNGPFEDARQLQEVPGIGERTFERFADLVVP